MNVLILHGIQGKAGENWTQWLSDSLSKKSYKVVMPNLTDADHPDRKTWFNEIKTIADKLSNDLIIVAHSLGVTSALDYIEQSPNKIKGLVSVSGFADDYGLELNSYFLKEKQINFDKVNKNLEKAFVFYGDDDPYVTQEALKSLTNELKVIPIVIKNGGHLNSSAGFTEFPKLLETVLSIS
jgi:uncharacterized protein